MYAHHTKPPETSPPPQQQGADWLSWSLHLFLGLFLGAAAGFLVWSRMKRFGLISEEQIFYIIAGVSLFCGAFTSYRGDRAWFSSSAFAPNAPPQSRASHACSWIIGSLGIGTVCLAVYRHLQTSVSRSSSHSISLLDIPVLLLLALLIGLVVHALRTGTALGAYGVINRDEAPTWFWLSVALTIVSAICILFRLLQ